MSTAVYYFYQTEYNSVHKHSLFYDVQCTGKYCTHCCNLVTNKLKYFAHARRKKLAQKKEKIRE